MTASETIRRLSRQHVSSALQRIDRDGIPKRRLSTRFCLVEGQKHYPPKLVLKFASEAAGVPIGKSHGREFFGGEQTNKPLRDLGFTVRECPLSRTHEYSPTPGSDRRPRAEGFVQRTSNRRLSSAGSQIPPSHLPKTVISARRERLLRTSSGSTQHWVGSSANGLGGGAATVSCLRSPTSISSFTRVASYAEPS